MFITAILQIVYCNGNKKSPWARSLNYAGNEYDFEYDFFQLLKNDENDILTICAVLQRLKTYSAMMETVFEICSIVTLAPKPLILLTFQGVVSD